MLLRLKTLTCSAILMVVAAPQVSAQRVWPEPSQPVVQGSDGYINIPNAAVKRDPARHYKAIFSMNKGAQDWKQPLPALKRAAYQLNGLKAARVPANNISFAIIVFGNATDALLTNAEYRKLHGADNPNIALLAGLMDNGVSIFVCGQHMAKHNLLPASIVKGVQVSEAATLVMITYADDGYALITD